MKYFHDEKVYFNKKYQIINILIKEEFLFNYNHDNIKSFYEISFQIIIFLIFIINAIIVKFIT